MPEGVDRRRKREAEEAKQLGEAGEVYTGAQLRVRHLMCAKYWDFMHVVAEEVLDVVGRAGVERQDEAAERTMKGILTALAGYCNHPLIPLDTDGVLMSLCCAKLRLCTPSLLRICWNDQSRRLKCSWLMKQRQATANEDQSELESDILEATCHKCKKGHKPEKMLLCDTCDRGWHLFCLNPPLSKIPQGEWSCPKCSAKAAKRLVSCDPRGWMTEPSVLAIDEVSADRGDLICLALDFSAPHLI